MIYTKRSSKTIRPKSFVEMRASLNSAESDVLDIIFYLMDRNDYDSEISAFTIDAHDYEGLFINTKGEVMTVKRIYERLLQGAEGLYNLDLQFTEETENIKKNANFRVLAATASNTGNYKIRLELTPIMERILQEQRKKPGYAIYDLKDQFALEDKYSKRLYPMLAKFRTTGKRYDNITELREKIGIPSGSSQSRFMSIFRKSIAEINEKTILSVNLEIISHPISGGKCVDGIRWTIQEKADPRSKNLTLKESGCIRKTKELFGEKITQVEAERISKSAGYDFEKVKQAEKVLRNYKKTVDDVTAFILTAIKQEWKAGNKKSKVDNIEHRDYDFVEIERFLLAGTEEVEL